MRVATQPLPPALGCACAHIGCVCCSLHACTAELSSEGLSCLIAAASEVRDVLHARTSPDPLLERVFSGNQFLPRALLVLPMPGNTRREVAVLPVCLNTVGEDFAVEVPKGLC